MLAPWRVHIRWTLITIGALLTVYLSAFGALYGIWGAWFTNKYNKFYFTGEDYYSCRYFRTSSLWFTYPTLIGYIEPLYYPLLTTIEINQSTPCPPQSLPEAIALRGRYGYSRRGFVGTYYLRPYGYGLSLLNTSRPLAESAADPGP